MHAPRLSSAHGVCPALMVAEQSVKRVECDNPRWATGPPTLRSMTSALSGHWCPVGLVNTQHLQEACLNEAIIAQVAWASYEALGTSTDTLRKTLGCLLGKHRQRPLETRTTAIDIELVACPQLCLFQGMTKPCWHEHCVRLSLHNPTMKLISAVSSDAMPEDDPCVHA
mmetsp:Transcript_58023/g.111908  ORF Transcript_58023/g.111908 Transcript_58023/m.111908 type:complete len:169 (-) Transcript_58023:1401-1907(-)